MDVILVFDRRIFAMGVILASVVLISKTGSQACRQAWPGLLARPVLSKACVALARPNVV